MKDILDKLVDSLNNGNIVLGLVIVAVALVFNYKKIVDFLEERKKARITMLTEALSCVFVTGLTKEHLQQELATEHFKITTGLRLEQQFREAVIEAHIAAKGELSFLHFRRALPHLFFEQNSLKVKITKLEQVSYWFNLIFGFVLAFLGLIMMVIISQMKDVGIFQVFSVFILGCFFVGVCIFMLSQTLPIVSAKKIEKLLANTIQKSIDQSTKDSPYD